MRRFTLYFEYSSDERDLFHECLSLFELPYFSNPDSPERRPVLAVTIFSMFYVLISLSGSLAPPDTICSPHPGRLDCLLTFRRH